MKLYYHPVSTTSRPVELFARESGIQLDFQVIDLMTGEHMKSEFAAKNPTKLVPLLEDGDFRLSESSAILKYLADHVDSPAYPRELKARAKVNEMMDWINTQVCRDFAYGLVYPQIFGMHKRPTDEHHKGNLQWSKERAAGWFKILDQNILGAGKKYLCGDQITIADYFASSFVSLGEAIGCDFAAYPNLKRWYEGMKSLKSWPKVYEVFYGFAGSLKGQSFEKV